MNHSSMDLRKLFQTSSASKPQTSVEHRFDAPSFVTARDRADPDFEVGSGDAAKRVPDGHNEEQGKRKMPRKNKRKKRSIEIPSIHEKAPAAQDPPPPSQAANLHPAPIQHPEIPSAKESAAPAPPSSLPASGPSSAPPAQAPPPQSQAAGLHPASIQYPEIPSAKESAAPAPPSPLPATGPSSASAQFTIAAQPTSATTCPASPFAMASAKVTASLWPCLTF
jgi:hypothetical protein